MTKLHKDEELRESFRKKYTVDSVARVTKDDKNYSYKAVIYNYEHNPKNFEEHEALGYEVVFSDDTLEDDRAFSPDNSGEKKLRKSPVEKRTKDGYQQVLMRISKQREQENFKADAQKRKEQYMNSSKRKITKQGNGSITITENEINPENLGDTNNE